LTAENAGNAAKPVKPARFLLIAHFNVTMTDSNVNTEDHTGATEMTTFFMFGNYTPDAVDKISAARTDSAGAIIAGCGGVLKSAYALLGETDIIAIAEFPSVEMALKASVALSKQLGITFKTAPAVSMDNFDRLVTEK